MTRRRCGQTAALRQIEGPGVAFGGGRLAALAVEFDHHHGTLASGSPPGSATVRLEESADRLASGSLRD